MRPKPSSLLLASVLSHKCLPFYIPVYSTPLLSSLFSKAQWLFRIHQQERYLKPLNQFVRFAFNIQPPYDWETAQE